jgi:hypothetical protein
VYEENEITNCWAKAGSDTYPIGPTENQKKKYAELFRIQPQERSEESCMTFFLSTGVNNGEYA